MALNVELDAFVITPYKQIFFFTRPWDIMEPAGMGPMMEGGSQGGSEEGSGSWDSMDSWDSTGSWDSEDSWGSTDSGSWDDRLM